MATKRRDVGEQQDPEGDPLGLQGEHNAGKAPGEPSMDSRDARMDEFVVRTDARLAGLEQSVAVIQSTMAAKDDVAALKAQMKAIATREDLAALRGELKADNAALRAELKADNAALRAELKADNAALRDELKADNAALRDELKADNAALRGEVLIGFRDQTWKMITSCAGLVAATFFIAHTAPAAPQAPVPVAATPAPTPAPIVIQIPAGLLSTAGPVAAPSTPDSRP